MQIDLNNDGKVAFFECSFVRKLLCSRWVALSRGPEVLAVARGKTVRVQALRAVIVGAVYYLWQERNFRKLSGLRRDCSQICQK
ncbi:hypothetical protein Ancab_017249, partial [Ancistrocladus abbreviatus]